MRERFNLKERINWFASTVMTLGIGSALLYAHFEAESVVIRVLLYLFGAIAITLGANSLIDFFESMIRGMDETKTPFAESVLWLSPAMFSLYQFYAVNQTIVRVILGILIIVFLFIFMAALSSAIGDTSLGKKKINILSAIIILSLFIVGASFLVQSTDILLFLLPTVIIVTYSVHILIGYLINEAPAERKQSQRGNILRGIKGNLSNAHRYFNKSFTKTLWLIGFFVIVTIFFVKGLLPWPETLSNIYAISLTIYIVILSIITGFSIGSIGQKRTSIERVIFTRPFLGLAQMCVVFIMISIIGIVIGGDIDITIFENGVSPINLLQSEEVLTNVLSISQVIIMEIVILSFLPTMMYIYAILEGIHSTKT